MIHSPILKRLRFSLVSLFDGSLWSISTCFQMLSSSRGQVSYALLTRSPLSTHPKVSFSFDLHVLGTPPAFILSQDQTLRIRAGSLGFFKKTLLLSVITILLLNCV